MAHQEPHDLRHESKDHRYDLRQQVPHERDGRADSAMRTGLHMGDGAAVWAAGGGGFAGAPVRGGLPGIGLAHSQVVMHTGQPVHAHQQTMQDLNYQIERIQHIMNELNQLRLPNEIMLQLSDYITYLRKQLHQLNLSVQASPIAAPSKNAILMEQHSAVVREPLVRDARGDANHFNPRQEIRGDRAVRVDRPSKRQWGPTETGGTYIERDGFVNDDRGADAEKQHGHGQSGGDDYGKRGR